MSEDNTTEATEEVKAPKRGVGDVAKEAIAAGKSNDEALASVQAEFPEAKTSLASINWYRNKMRSTDPSIPTARELKAAAKATKAAEATDDTGANEADPLD